MNVNSDKGDCVLFDVARLLNCNRQYRRYAGIFAAITEDEVVTE